MHTMNMDCTTRIGHSAAAVAAEGRLPPTVDPSRLIERLKAELGTAGLQCISGALVILAPAMAPLNLAPSSYVGCGDEDDRSTEYGQDRMLMMLHAMTELADWFGMRAIVIVGTGAMTVITAMSLHGMKTRVLEMLRAARLDADLSGADGMTFIIIYATFIMNYATIFGTKVRRNLDTKYATRCR